MLSLSRINFGDKKQTGESEEGEEVKRGGVGEKRNNWDSNKGS